MKISRATLWFGVLATYAGAVYFLMNTTLVPGLLLMLASVACGTYAEIRAKRQREYRVYEGKYGASLEQVRSTIDIAAVRRIREEKGDIKAIRAVRRQAPGVPLKDAVKLVEGL